MRLLIPATSASAGLLALRIAGASLALALAGAGRFSPDAALDLPSHLASRVTA